MDALRLSSTPQIVSIDENMILDTYRYCAILRKPALLLNIPRNSNTTTTARNTKAQLFSTVVAAVALAAVFGQPCYGIYVDTFGDWDGVFGDPIDQATVDAQTRLRPFDLATETIPKQSGLRPSDLVSVRLRGSGAPVNPVTSPGTEMESWLFSDEVSVPAVAIAPNFIVAAQHTWWTGGENLPRTDLSTTDAALLPANARNVFLGDSSTPDFRVTGVSTIIGLPDALLLRVEPAAGSSYSELPAWARTPVATGQTHEVNGALAAIAGRGPHRRRYLENATLETSAQTSFSITSASSASRYGMGHGELAWGANVVESDGTFTWEEPESPSYLANTNDKSYHDQSVVSSFEHGVGEGDSGSAFLVRDGLDWSLYGVLANTAGVGADFTGSTQVPTALITARLGLNNAITSLGGVTHGGQTGLTLADLPTTQATISWTGAATGGGWGNAAGWSRGGAPAGDSPGVDDVVRIDTGTHLGIDSASPTAKHLVVGWEGAGTAEITHSLGETVSFSDVVMLGYGQGATGRYNLGNGGLSSATLYVGYDGAGEFNQTGGTNLVRDTVYVGQSDATSTYVLNSPAVSSGDRQLHARRVVVGALGKGRFEHQVGNALMMRLSVGHGDASEGEYVQTGGVLTVTERLEVGVDGAGALTLDGATVNAGYQVDVGATGSLVFQNYDSTLTLTGGAAYDSAIHVDTNAPINGADQHLKLAIDFSQEGLAIESQSENTATVDFGRDLLIRELTLGNQPEEAVGKLKLTLGSESEGHDLFVGGPDAPDALSILAGFDSSAFNPADLQAGDGTIYYYTTTQSHGPGYVQLLPGDADLDGDVDPADMALLGSNWLSGDQNSWRDGDFNGDGQVDPGDIALLGSNWLAGPFFGAPPTNNGVATPEPSGLAMAALIAAGWCSRSGRAGKGPVRAESP